MFRTRTSIPALLLALVVALVSACASAGGGAGTGDTGEGSGPAATVTVNNNLSLPTSLTVSIIPEAGVRRLLGNVAPSGRTSLRYRGSTIGRFRLHARTTSGQEIVSDPFSLGAGDEVTWELQTNIIRLGGS